MSPDFDLVEFFNEKFGDESSLENLPAELKKFEEEIGERDAERALAVSVEEGVDCCYPRSAVEGGVSFVEKFSDGGNEITQWGIIFRLGFFEQLRPGL